MLTRRVLETLLHDLIQDLYETGMEPQKVILFGSYANGGVHNYSDIDIAVWSNKFVGEGLIDFELIRPMMRKYRNLDIKMYPKGATAQNFDPFIKVIEDTGRKLTLPEKSISS